MKLIDMKDCINVHMVHSNFEGIVTDISVVFTFLPQVQM